MFVFPVALTVILVGNIFNFFYNCLWRIWRIQIEIIESQIFTLMNIQHIVHCIFGLLRFDVMFEHTENLLTESQNLTSLQVWIKTLFSKVNHQRNRKISCRKLHIQLVSLTDLAIVSCSMAKQIHSTCATELQYVRNIDCKLNFIRQMVIPDSKCYHFARVTFGSIFMWFSKNYWKTNSKRSILGNQLNSNITHNWSITTDKGVSLHFEFIYSCGSFCFLFCFQIKEK